MECPRKIGARSPGDVPPARGALALIVRAAHLITALAATGGFACTEGAGAFEIEERTPEPGPRLLVLAIDSVSHEALKTALAGGAMPQLQALLQDGAFLPLAPTLPPARASSWTTFATGLPPAQHGVFGDTRRLSRVDRVRGVVSAEPMGAKKNGFRVDSSRFGVPFWDTLAAAGGRLSALYVPFAMPIDAKSYARLVAGQPFPGAGGFDARFFYLAPTLPTDAPPSVKLQTLARSGPGIYAAAIRIGGEGKSALEATVRVERSGEQLNVRIEDTVVRVPATANSAWVDLRLRRGGDFVPARTRVHVLSVEPPQVLIEPFGVDPESPGALYALPAELPSRLAGIAGPRATASPFAIAELARAGVVSTSLANTVLEDSLRSWGRSVVAALRIGEGSVVVAGWGGMSSAWTSGAGLRSDTSLPLQDALDDVVGRIAAEMGEQDSIVLLSTVGGSLRDKAIDLNAWLAQRRYLAFDDAGAVDWAKTQAYALGDGRVYLNVEGREPAGVVKPARAPRLAKKLSRELKGLRFRGRVVADVLAGDDVLAGERRGSAPDLMVVFTKDFADRSEPLRASESVGVVLSRPVFESAAAAREIATGFVLSNTELAVETPAVEDVATTAASFLGLDPGPLNGASWFPPGHGVEKQ